MNPSWLSKRLPFFSGSLFHPLVFRKCFFHLERIDGDRHSHLVYHGPFLQIATTLLGLATNRYRSFSTHREKCGVHSSSWFNQATWMETCCFFSPNRFVQGFHWWDFVRSVALLSLKFRVVVWWRMTCEVFKCHRLRKALKLTFQIWFEEPPFISRKYVNMYVIYI